MKSDQCAYGAGSNPVKEHFQKIISNGTMDYSMMISLKDTLDILFTIFLLGMLIYGGFMLRKAKRALDEAEKLLKEEHEKLTHHDHHSQSKIEQALMQRQRGQKLNSIQKTVQDLGVNHLKNMNTKLDKLETESGILSIHDIGIDHWRAKNSRYN